MNVYHNGSIIVKNGIAYVVILYKNKWYLRKVKDDKRRN